ncbi:MAG: outer membrane beta-barrel family protein [Agriterribacter sp.]
MRYRCLTLFRHFVSSNIKEYTLFIITLILFTTYLPAQPHPTIAVKGKVIEAQHSTALGFATISLFRQGDSSALTSVNTNEAGEFSIETVPGSYYIMAEFVGYKNYKSTVFHLTKEQTAHNLGIIKLVSASKTLDEVVIQAEKSSMTLSLDKKIFNVGKDLANAGGTAADILTNIPSVAVDVDGNVSLRGSSSVRILIDGKPSGLVSIKGGSGLQQLQASMIDRVEIITNPSARYEAEGMGGIINIILKKERQQGFNGSFDIIAGYPENFGIAANVNYRHKKFNFFINYSTSYRNAPGKSDQYQEFYRNDTNFVSTKTAEYQLKGLYNTARAGLDYYFDTKNILTAAYTYRISKGKRFSDILYHDYLNSLKDPTGISHRTQDETETEPNSEYSLSYKRTFAREGHELTVDARYLDNWEDSDQFFGEDVYKPDGSPSGIPYLLQRAVNFETEKQYLLQIDYVHPFGEKGKFETGLRTSFRDMTNDYTVTQRDEDNNWFELNGLTNNFIYNEKISAVYAILGNKVKKISYQLGLRGELTNVTTTLKQTNEINPRKYVNLFPSAHVSYELPKGHAIQLSYSRRIRRPQYNDLSPFMTYSDNRNYWSGNPDLNPEFTHSFEIGHIKYISKSSFSSSLYYRNTRGKIMSVRRVDSLGNSVTLPENLATENSFGAEFTGSYTPWQWWKMDGSFNFFRAITDGSNLSDEFKSDTYSWFVRFLSRFTFWKNTDLQLRGNYEAPQQMPQGRQKSIATLDLAISKDILKNNGTLTLNVTDVFNSRKYRSITEGSNFYTVSNSQGRLRQLNLTFNYRLRQAKKKEKATLEGE